MREGDPQVRRKSCAPRALSWLGAKLPSAPTSFCWARSISETVEFAISPDPLSPGLCALILHPSILPLERRVAEQLAHPHRRPGRTPGCRLIGRFPLRSAPLETGLTITGLLSASSTPPASASAVSSNACGFRPDLTLLADICPEWRRGSTSRRSPLACEPRRPARRHGWQTQGEYADIYACGSVSLLGVSSPPLGRPSVVRDRRHDAPGRAAAQLTQQASLIVFRHGLNGICYRSRYGHSIENSAIFEFLPLTTPPPPRDAPSIIPRPAFRLQLHGLSMREGATVRSDQSFSANRPIQLAMGHRYDQPHTPAPASPTWIVAPQRRHFLASAADIP